MKTRSETVIDCFEWDKLVTETYGKPYCFQQQQGCQSRRRFKFSVPAEAQDDEMNESLPEVVNHERMGVRFEAWKARDPRAPLCESDKCRHDQGGIDLWWHRNFYPDFQTVANDLHAKGILAAGDYTIDIDW